MQKKDYYVDPSFYNNPYVTGVSNANFDSENPYEVLGVHPDSSMEEITHKRNELAKLYHPDFNEHVSNLDIIQKINNAYSEIKKEKGITENNNVKPVISNTNIPKPRKKRIDEDYEDYEIYLHDYYKSMGKDYKIENYPNTDIPKPRMLYPHEIDDNSNKEYYINMIKYFGNKYQESQKSNNASKPPTTESKELTVIDNSKDLMSDENEKDDNDVHEVKGIRKATDFLKKHKKVLLIAAGLTAAVIVGHAYIIPALMQANSTLWASTHAFPLIQDFLHGCNLLLGKMIGATYASSGLWTSATGALINAEAAKASVLGALTLHTLNIGAIGYTAKKLIEKFKNRKKNIEEENTTKIENQNIEENEGTSLLGLPNGKTLTKEQQLSELNNQKLLLNSNNNESNPYETQGGIKR